MKTRISDDIPPTANLRAEIAAAAARLVADEGLDYGSAKQRGAREVIGLRAVPRNCMPGNDELEQALAEHLRLFDPDHDARLARLREVAIEWMRRLERFNPLATGAVWKGLATEHAVVHLQLFCDNGKEVQYALIDARVDFEAGSTTHFRGSGEVEAYEFEWQGEGVVLSVYDHDDIKGALKPVTTTAQAIPQSVQQSVPQSQAAPAGASQAMADALPQSGRMAARGPLAALLKLHRHVGSD